MNNQKSTPFGKEQSKQAASTSKDAILRRRHPNSSRVQNVLLLWLDHSIDEGNHDCRNTLRQLRRVVNSIDTFTDSDQCVTFLSEIKDNKVCMIISGSLGQHIVPMIHDMSQLDSIFIFCGNKKRHEQWVKEWPKIRGVFTEITSICEALKQAAQECEHNALAISFRSTSGTDSSNKNLNQLDVSFMYTQILKEILITIKFEEQHIKQYINYCREVFVDNERELHNAKQFKRKYHDKSPIWWYTYECFVYPMLNYALRIMDVDIIIKMGFFIRDLHQHIQQLHKEQFGDHHSRQVFTVYRGQGLGKTDFEQLMNTKGGLISFNNFLSTSQDHKVSRRFARRAVKNPDLVGILFVMTINPSISSTPFASINKVSYYQNTEDEILFSMHTVFRIREIKQMGETNRLWQVELILTSDNDQELQALTERMREDSFPDAKGWYRLGSVLLNMGQSEKSQQVYEMMLEQTTDEYEKGNIYNRLGMSKYNQGKNEQALTFYKKSHEIYRKILPENHLNLAVSCNNIGLVYHKMGEYSKALSYYEKTLEIQQQSLPSNHPGLAKSHKNIGNTNYMMGEYSKALSSHEKDLEINKKSLPANHPDLAASYNNIGTVYHNMGEHSKALSYYEKTLEIQQKSLPSNHPDLAQSYNNISVVYDTMSEYSKALSYHEKAFEIRQKSLPSNHPDLAASYNNIGTVYGKMGEYSKALSYYEKAFEINQKSLPANHPHLALSYKNIGIVYYMLGDYSKALSYYGKDLQINQKSLPANHPDLGASYDSIGLVYNNMDESAKALSYYGKAFEIRQKSLPSNHPDLGSSYNNIGIVYKKMGEYSKALSSHEKALEIRQKSLPANHPDLAASYNNIGEVYKSMGDNQKALSYYEKCLGIMQKSLPATHPNLAYSYNNIGLLYMEMREYSKALSYYKRAVDIGEHSLSPNHPELQMYRNNLDLLKKKL